MSSEISRQFPIHEGMLSREFYTQSLLQQAARLGLLTPQQTEYIQLEIATLLQKQLTRFTYGESSSVKGETAQGILRSMLFHVSLKLKSCDSIKEQLRLLTCEGMETLHTQGRELAKAKLLHAKALLAEVLRSRMATDNEAYNQTIETALPDFFRAYELYYAAHDIPCMIDYPLGLEVTDRAGIEYMEEFLQRLAWEDAFCARYSAKSLTQLLASYHPGFKDLLENIFSLALTNALGSILLGKGGENLNLQHEEIDTMMNLLAGLAPEEYRRRMDEAVKQLTQLLTDGADDYVSRCARKAIVRIDAARQGLCPSPFTVLKPAANEAFVFSDRARMDNDRFRLFTEELRDCRTIQDKLRLVRREVKSFGDLNDMLSAECFFNEEYQVLFGALNDFELALLHKAIPAEDEDGSLHRTEAEKDWQQAFITYMNTLDDYRRKTITALAAQIVL